MQQRQPRLGDILDDYCPRERRLTNHVVVAMVGDDVQQTRCTTCESDHPYKHAAVPRSRKKSEESSLYSQVLAGVSPKKITTVTESVPNVALDEEEQPVAAPSAHVVPAAASTESAFDDSFDLPSDDDADGNRAEQVGEGPAHRRLIRAQLPRHEGQVANTRQAPDFTIRQPTNVRAKRFVPRNQRPGGGGAQFQGSRQGPGGGTGNGNGNGNGNSRGGASRPGGQRHGGPSRPGNRQGGRNRPK